MEGLRPLSLGELLDASFRIYRSRARTLLLAVAVPVVPVLVFSSLVSLSAQTSLTVDSTTGVPTLDGGDLALTAAGFLVTVVASLVATAIATAACFRSISGAYVGDDPDWRESLRFAVSRLWSVIGLSLLTGLATVAGVLVCLVGILYPMAIFAVAVPALLMEGLGPASSMGRSRDLVRGSGWRVLGIVLLGTLLAFAFQAVVSIPLGVLLLVDPGPVVSQVITVLVQVLATVVVTPFSAALTMALYVDLRVRKEGFDLVLWAQRLGTSAPAGGFPAQPGAPALGPGWGPGPAGWVPAPGAYEPGGSWGPTAPPGPPGWAPPPPPPPPPPPASGPGPGWGPPPAGPPSSPPDA
ncbi:MAG: hypothetical protein KF703_16595 [Actinobacteria bacterium]|nr:hypothetical protein [Actinomycetota bacterium]